MQGIQGSMEMEQLLSMGFPQELAAQALKATGGKSIHKATEWIFTHESSPTSSSSPGATFTSGTHNTASNNLSPFQPKLDRFFHFHANPSSSLTPTAGHNSQQKNSVQNEEKKQDTVEDLTPTSKRVRLLNSPSFCEQQREENNTQLLLGDVYQAKVAAEESEKQPHQPLYERMRPRTVNEILGQDHILGANSLLRSAIEHNRLPSIIFWGPPGTGKTSIAKALVNSAAPQKQQKCSFYRFVSLSSVTCGVKDVRDVVEEARKLRFKNNQRTLLFVDEVHRFNKSQQDSFLPVIEDGSIVFIGATTENPSFHLITPLLSRCRVLTVLPLKPEHVALLLKRAVDDLEKGLARSIGFQVDVIEEAIDFIAHNCDGDARVALNALEIAATTAVGRLPECNHSINAAELEDLDVNSLKYEGYGISSCSATIILDDAKEALQCKHLAYDKAGEEHYNLISALHKSMRGSDANAAIYWLARMLEGGEQPLYIARRLIRFASEDVGLADPSALNQAVSCYQACHFLGMPECNVILAQCVAYLALAPKSVSVYRAIRATQKVVKESIGQNEGVPHHLRNAPTNLMKKLGYGKGYLYPPDNPSSSQNYLPPSLQGYTFLNWPEQNNNDEQ